MRDRPTNERKARNDLFIKLSSFLISIYLPLVAKTVIPEEILIGNPASNRL